MKYLHTPISLVGGKNKLKRRLVNMFPQHTVYVEPFFGAGHLLFWKEPSRFEWVFDKDDLLINLWKTMKDPVLLKEFLEYLDGHPKSRTIFTEYREICSDPEKYSKISPSIRAAMCYFILKCAYGAAEVFTGRESWGFYPCNNKMRGFYTTNWDLIFRRLHNVNIENRDFRKCFELLSKVSKETFIYCDPPYMKTMLGSNSKHQLCYRFNFNEQDHIDLANCLRNFPGLFMLSIYFCEEVEKLYSGFNFKVVETYYTCQEQGNDIPVKEYIITNYEVKEVNPQKILF